MPEPMTDERQADRLGPGATLRRLLPLLRPHRLAVAVAAVALLLSAGIGLAFPLIVQFMLDAAFQAGDSETLTSIALLLVGMFGVQAVTNFVQVTRCADLPPWTSLVSSANTTSWEP